MIPSYEWANFSKFDPQIDLRKNSVSFREKNKAWFSSQYNIWFSFCELICGPSFEKSVSGYNIFKVWSILFLNYVSHSFSLLGENTPNQERIPSGKIIRCYQGYITDWPVPDSSQKFFVIFSSHKIQVHDICLNNHIKYFFKEKSPTWHMSAEYHLNMAGSMTTPSLYLKLCGSNSRRRYSFFRISFTRYLQNSIPHSFLNLIEEKMLFL